MKIFKIYGKMDEYVVLQCPHCGRQFRSPTQQKVFGKERKNAKCQKCEKLFDFNKSQLSEDALAKSWNSDEEMIMIKPDGSQEFFKREVFKSPDFKLASELK